MARLRKFYAENVRKQLQDKFEYDNPMRIPRIEKIVINMGVGEGAKDSKKLTAAQKQLGAIAGQRPVLTKAKNSIAGFKIREGMNIGTKVTLRKGRMYEFLDRLVNIALPRVRDFRGLSAKGFDKAGNYNFGIKEQLVFPEINYDEVDQVRGMDINIVTTAPNDAEATELLKAFNLPLN